MTGGNTLNLPTGWVAGQDTTGMTQLNSSLKPVSIATERKKYKAGLMWHFNRQWSANLQYFNEKKDGFDITSGIFGTSGGNPLAAVLPRPINFNTNDVNFELSYNDNSSQLSFRYHLSLFENSDSLTWQNPYSLMSPLQTAYPDQGRLAYEPDNQAHQLSLNFAHRFNRTTRLSGKFSYGWMLQDQDFLPYTVNPALNVTTPLPRNSLDARVNNLHGNLTFSARPFKKMNFKARYTYTERDNQTPTDAYAILRNDSEDQETAADSDVIRTNLPYNYRKHKTQLDLGYRLFNTVKLTAGYDFERIERDYAEVYATNEHTGRLKLTASPFNFMTTRLQYAHSMRNGSDYRHNKLYTDSHTQQFLDTLPADRRFSNNPLLRKFQYSDRVRDRVDGNVTLIPTDRLTLGLSGFFLHDNYDALIGLSSQTRLSGTFDVSYAFSKHLELHSFYTQEYFLSRQTGFARRSVEAALPPLDPDSFWWLDNEDTVHTVGAGLSWTLIEDTLDIGLDYLYSRAVTEIDPSRNDPVTDLPNINTELHSLNFHGDYRLQKNLSLRLSYRYESLLTEDFARDGVQVDTMDRVISLGSSSPDYNAHVFGLTMLYNF
nr:MtrB/PioB family decaheme-associated outer membrane protein [Methylomarinum sp. Ch1-1]MDP4522490.1 MtrB/PioB family decaheme-associated outer membrane protein [Methylomarinum sp. Ch1-1]